MTRRLSTIPPGSDVRKTRVETQDERLRDSANGKYSDVFRGRRARLDQLRRCRFSDKNVGLPPIQIIGEQGQDLTGRLHFRG